MVCERAAGVCVALFIVRARSLVGWVGPGCCLAGAAVRVSGCYCMVLAKWCPDDGF